jgi:hypothetical protein
LFCSVSSNQEAALSLSYYCREEAGSLNLSNNLSHQQLKYPQASTQDNLGRSVVVNVKLEYVRVSQYELKVGQLSLSGNNSKNRMNSRIRLGTQNLSEN